jgi:hypothetical protein
VSVRLVNDVRNRKDLSGREAALFDKHGRQIRAFCRPDLADERRVDGRWRVIAKADAPDRSRCDGLLSRDSNFSW